jgi:phosphate transport system substrate-binding protein
MMEASTSSEISMTSGKNDLPALLLTTLITLGLLGGGLWFVGRKFLGGGNQATNPSGTQAGTQAGNPTDPSAASPPAANSNSTSASGLNTSQPNPSILAIDGSVSLVALIKQLQNAYLQVNPSIPSTYGVPDGQPNGTNAGIQNLLDGKVSMAVSSRPLKPNELTTLQAVPIARDALAVAVGANNPYKGGLTLNQLKQIFQGKITNWSEVGGPNLPIRVINRAASSGTHTFFQDVVLLGEPFAADGANFSTAQRDETTPLLQALGEAGITYSTVTQTANQQTVRNVSIDGVDPTDQNAVKSGTYPISRVTYLVVPKQTSPAVQQFVDLALSDSGKQIISRLGFAPIQ